MAGMEMCAKQDKQTGKDIIQAALVETFAIFAFVLSLLGVLGLTA
jgi:F0F1-type ATP synthase membrane subunit c/vacuolar-type H+-ATPase subunit K